MNNSRCPGCGHNFYTDSPARNGYCKWCVNEQDNPSYCYICGSTATCSSPRGYLCDSSRCHDTDDRRMEDQYREQYDDDY